MKKGVLRMIKKSIIIATLVLSLGFATLAMADPDDSAQAHVYLNIDPNIAVEALTANVSGGTLQTGIREIPILFRIDANTEAVALSALVTQLYKGDDPNNTEVAPVAVDLTEGVDVAADNAHAINGQDDNLPYSGNTSSVQNEKGTFAGYLTSEVTFESSQNGHFSQNVLLTPSWTNEDNEKPQGEYSGYVVLYASVVD